MTCPCSLGLEKCTCTSACELPDPVEPVGIADGVSGAFRSHVRGLVIAVAACAAVASVIVLAVLS